MDPFLTHGLASLPTWAAVLITMGGPVVLALLFGAAMFSLFTEQEFRNSAFVGAVKYGFVVEFYAAIAALTLVGAWEIYASTRDRLQQETGALYMLALAVDSYAQPAQEALREEMRDAIRGYARAVATIDWPDMQAGMPATGSEAAFQRLTRAFLDAEPVTAAQEALQQNTVEWVNRVSDARIARLSVTSQTLSGLMWLLVMVVSVGVISFQWFVGSSNHGMHYAIGAVIAVIVGGVLLASIKMAHPFVGDPALLSPQPFLDLARLR